MAPAPPPEGLTHIELGNHTGSGSYGDAPVLPVRSSDASLGVGRAGSVWGIPGRVIGALRKSLPLRDGHKAGADWGTSAGRGGLRRISSVGALEESERDAPRGRKVQPMRVLGVDLTAWSATGQYLFCAALMCAFLLMYGVLQEKIVVQVFRRRFGLFVTLLQFTGYSAFALLNRLLFQERIRRVPMRYYVCLGAAQAVMQGLTNLSMMYLNYPAKVLFKSSRMVCTILVGALFWGRKYSRTDYCVALLMIMGLGVFVTADAQSSPDYHPTGVALICVSLTMDAVALNFQEQIMRSFEGSHDEMVLYTYGWGAVFLAITTTFTGNLAKGLAFLQGGMSNDDVGAQPVLADVIFQMMLFTACGFIGVSLVTALTKRFGALISALTTTARKAMTLMLSFVIFPKPVATGHVVGSLLLIFAMLFRVINRAILSSREEKMRQLARLKAASANAGVLRQGGGASWAVDRTLTHRKHLADALV